MRPFGGTCSHLAKPVNPALTNLPTLPQAGQGRPPGRQETRTACRMQEVWFTLMAGLPARPSLSARLWSALAR